MSNKKKATKKIESGSTEKKTVKVEPLKEQVSLAEANKKLWAQDKK